MVVETGQATVDVAVGASHHDVDDDEEPEI